MHTTCWNRANMPSARVSKRGDCPAWNFDWQHFCVSTFLAATVRECVGVSACMWVVRVCALCLCVCISQSSIKLFVLFGLPFCFFFSTTLFICLKRNYCARQRVAASSSVQLAACPASAPAPIRLPTHSLLPTHCWPRLPCNFVALFNAFALAHCICWHFICHCRWQEEEGGGGCRDCG